MNAIPETVKLEDVAAQVRIYEINEGTDPMDIALRKAIFREIFTGFEILMQLHLAKIDKIIGDLDFQLDNTENGDLSFSFVEIETGETIANAILPKELKIVGASKLNIYAAAAAKLWHDFMMRFPLHENPLMLEAPKSVH